MRVAIFIRSYSKDACWLEYALRSIRKFTTGFEYVMVAIPSKDHAVFAPLQAKYGIRLFEYGVMKSKPMLSGEVQLCHAEEICSEAEAVCLLDSLDFLVRGRPVLIAQSYELLARDKNPGVVWQGMAERALGWKPTHETMRHPTIFLRGTFAPFRAAVEKHTGRLFDDYVLSCREEWPQTFAELTSLGAFAARFFPEQYFLADVHTDAAKTVADSGAPITALKLIQRQSRDPIPVAEFEEILK